MYIQILGTWESQFQRIRTYPIAEDEEINYQSGSLLNWEISGFLIRMDDNSGKHSRTKNDNWSKLEEVEDVLVNILSRLPVRSLGICKTTSKHLRGLIRSPDFISLQLRQSKENPMYILYPYIDEIMVLHLMSANGEIFEEITFPGFEDLSSPCMISSYNGLICCVNYASPSRDVTDVDIRICNPVTRDVLLLPKGSPSEVEPSIGVAFGPGINEYKIFRFFKKEKHKKEENKIEEKVQLDTEESWESDYKSQEYAQEKAQIDIEESWESDCESQEARESDCESQEEPYDCEVYSSISGTWRGIGSVEHRPMDYNHVFINGTVYWFVSSEEDRTIPGSIISVDMDTNFQVINLPDEATEHSFLVDLEGCLSLIIVYDDDDELVDIWVLQDCNESIWVKKCSDNVPVTTMECVDSVVVRKNEIFFATTDHYLIFNLDDRTWRELDLGEPFTTNFTIAFPFTESLLPCNGVLGS